MAILREFEALRLPSPEIAAWFRETLAAAFDDASRSRAQMMRMLSKRKSELAGMKDRLLNIYLTGGIEEAIYQAKAAEIARDAEDTERQIAETEAQDYDAKRRETALAVFDFSQNLAEIWRGSNSTDRREILECISLNRVLTDVSLVLTKTKPFDALAEQAVVNDGRGERI